MDATSRTSPAKDKKPMRLCPKCPHRLSDLWSHKNPAEATQPTSEASKEDTFIKNDDQDDDHSSSTAVEDDFYKKDNSRMPPDYPDTASEGTNPPDSEKEYQELQSDDEHESSDEYETEENYMTTAGDHSDEEHLLEENLAEAKAEGNQARQCACTDDEKPAWFKCKICEPWVPLRLNAEARENVKLVPELCICHCTATHGNPTKSEKIEATFANEELGESWETSKQYMLNKMFNQPTLFKRCDKCKAGLEDLFGLFMGLKTDKQDTQELVKSRITSHLLVKAESLPSWYNCYCGQNHGFPGQAASTEAVNPVEQNGESSNTVKDEKLGTKVVADDEVIGRIVEDGCLILWKLCDKCEEIKQLPVEPAGDFNNPRLAQLHAEVLVYAEAELEREDGNQFEEWKQGVEDALAATAQETAKVPEGLSTLVEEDED